MVAVDDGLVRQKSKLELNGAKRLKHYWRGKANCCDCGCTERIYVKGKPICRVELQELLNDLGYCFEKNYKGVEYDKLGRDN
jgi:ribosomal protein S14